MKSLTAKQQDNGFTGVVPVEPSGGKPSKFNFKKDSVKMKDINKTAHPGKKGRKILDASKDSPEKNEASIRTRGRKNNVSVDDVDKLLENDAAALLNMRKDIQMAQEKEMVKARAYLSNLQKESNALKTSNDVKQKQYADLVDTKINLDAYVKKGEESAKASYDIIGDIKGKLQGVEEDMAAEQRTRDMMVFMRHRLEQETFAIKSATHQLNQQLEQVRSEYSSVDSAIRITRVELAAEEKHVESLQKAIKERTDQRLMKMQQLQSLVHEGENSVVRAQESIKKGQTGTRDRIAWEDEESTSFISPKATGKLKIPPAVESLVDNESTDENHDDNVAVNLTKEKINEVLEWYKSKEARIEELVQVQTDLKESIAKERTKKIQIEALLERSRNKVLLLASNRQMYQEVDMKDAALASARKEGDEFQEKDYRLRKNIEALRRSIPRFLQKIVDGGLNSSDCKPVPIDQLPDVVHKLEDEIARLIKQIGEKMLKDATQEDLANMSSSIQEFSAVNNDNTASETSRLHKLPGYNRLQKQLFNNLMSAVPDSTTGNVRVKVGHNYKDDITFFPNQIRENPDMMVSSGGTRKVNNEGVVDRDTIKSISQLVAKKENPAPKKEKTNFWS